MKRLVVVLAVLLVGCSAKARWSEHVYENVSEAGTSVDMCRVARETRQLWAEVGDSHKETEWAATAAMDCLRASMQHPGQ
jgi:hypothetical protein